MWHRFFWHFVPHKTTYFWEKRRKCGTDFKIFLKCATELQKISQNVVHNFRKFFRNVVQFFAKFRRKKTVPHEGVIFDLTLPHFSQNVVVLPHFGILCHIATRKHEKVQKCGMFPPPTLGVRQYALAWRYLQ